MKYFYSFLALVLLVSSCSKEEAIIKKEPLLEIAEVRFIRQHSAIVSYLVTNIECDRSLVRGICWSKTPNPSFRDSRYTDTICNGAQHGYLNDLEPETKYYVRAFMLNSKDTLYSREVSFETDSLEVSPILDTNRK